MNDQFFVLVVTLLLGSAVVDASGDNDGLW